MPRMLLAPCCSATSRSTAWDVMACDAYMNDPRPDWEKGQSGIITAGSIIQLTRYTTRLRALSLCTHYD